MKNKRNRESSVHVSNDKTGKFMMRENQDESRGKLKKQIRINWKSKIKNKNTWKTRVDEAVSSNNSNTMIFEAE